MIWFWASPKNVNSREGCFPERSRLKTQKSENYPGPVLGEKLGSSSRVTKGIRCYISLKLKKAKKKS